MSFGAGRRQDGPRLSWAAPVEFGTSKRNNAATVHNVSPGGMGLLTPVIYPPGSNFQFAILEEGQDPVEGTGEVRWTRLRESKHRPDAKFEMGVKVVDPDDAWRALFERIHKIVPAPPSHPVRFVAPDELTAILNGALGTKPPQLDIAAKPQHGELVLVPATLAEVTDTAWALGRIVEVRETDGADPGGVGLRYLRMVAGPESTIRADLGMLSAKLGVRVLDVTA